MDQPENSPLTVRAGVVSRILAVSHPTIGKLVKRGLLRVAGRTPGGQALYDLAEAQALRMQLCATDTASVSGTQQDVAERN